jgi:hypothetical protein
MKVFLALLALLLATVGVAAESDHRARNPVSEAVNSPHQSYLIFWDDVSPLGYVH